MASARRVQLTPVPQHWGTDLPPGPGLMTPPALSTRLELLLFEPDDVRCAEFHYPELTALRGKGRDEAWSEGLQGAGAGGGGGELQALARMFQNKYGRAPKQRRDRVQDLVDMGYGYDETDSFIDNSEAYDEFVPACLTTKYGGFYINVGTLHFRQASGEGHESDDFEENVKPKKRKLKEGGVMMNKNKKRKEDVHCKGENAKHSVPSVDKKKKARQQQDLDGMLKKFHKEKLQELQLSIMKRKESPPADDRDSVSADPISTLVGAASDAEFLQVEMEQDGLSTNDQNQENRETAAETFQASLPDGLPPTLEQSLQELTQGMNESEERNKMEVFAPEINSILLDVSVQWKELSDEVCSRIFSYLSYLLSCNKDALLKRARKLCLLQLDDQLEVLIQSLEETVFRVMPEQIERFNNHCQAHSAKLEAVKEKRAAEGSDEEEDDLSGKRVFGPRKRFKWNKEIRELLCELVRLKMSSYELEAPCDQSLEAYLKAFLEASVKPLWPRGWMQSRILLIESRRVHAHITGVVARKKSPAVPRSDQHEENADVPENTAQPAAKSQKIPPACGAVVVLHRLPAEEKKPENLSGVEPDVYFPPSLLRRDLAATEGSCGDPALPTPSLSHQTSHLHASAFPALPHDGKPAGHTDVCRPSTLSSVAPGTFQYGLEHDGSHAGGTNAQRELRSLQQDCSGEGTKEDVKDGEQGE